MMRKLIVVGSIAGVLLAAGGLQAAQAVYGCLPSDEDGRVCYATGNSTIHRRIVVSVPGTGLGKISVYQDSTGKVSAGAAVPGPGDVRVERRRVGPGVDCGHGQRQPERHPARSLRTRPLGLHQVLTRR